MVKYSEYESRITFVSNFGVGGGLHSLLKTEHLQIARYRTSDLTDFQNAVACKGYTSVLSKMVSVIFAVLVVSF